jgi:hypothetical protein
MDSNETDLMALAQAMGVPAEMARIQARQRRAQGFMETPLAQGRQVGQTYVASSPLEHLASAMSRYIGTRDMKAAEQDMGPLAQRQQAGQAAQLRMERGDKQFGQAIQLGGLKRQIAADEAAAADRTARLDLDRGARATADAQAMAREADAARDAKFQQDKLALDREGLGLRRDEIASTKETKAKEASGKATEDLRKEFQGLQTYKNTQTVAESAKKILTASETGAGDLNLLYGYMRMVDPGSTVREGEFAQAASSGSLPQRIQGWASKVLAGEKLPDAVRKQFKDEARTLLKAQRDRYEETASPYRRLAEQAGGAPGDVVLDLGLDAMLAPPEVAPASQPPVPVKTKAQRDALPPGTQYVGPDGQTYTKR